MGTHPENFMFLISSSRYGATTVRRTSDIAKAFAIANSAPKPVAITVWHIVDEKTRFAYPFNFICESKDEIFRTFGLITSGEGLAYDNNSTSI